MAKAKWLDLGVITKNEVKGKDGKVLLGDDGKPVTELGFRISKEVHEVLTKAGYNISEFGKMKTPQQEVEGLIKAGFIKEEEVEERRSKAVQTNSWLRYKVQVPPPRQAAKN